MTTHTTILQPMWASTRTFTHSHWSWSSIIPYLLPHPFTIHDILPVQFTCLTVFFHNLSKFSLVYLLALHPPLHTPYISSPTIDLYLELLCCSLSSHIYLTIFSTASWSATSFSFLTGQVALPCNILLCTQLLYNLPHHQWYILIGKQWYLLPEFIPSSSNFGLHSCIIIFIYTQHVT